MFQIDIIVLENITYNSWSKFHLNEVNLEIN